MRIRCRHGCKGRETVERGKVCRVDRQWRRESGRRGRFARRHLRARLGGEIAVDNLAPLGLACAPAGGDTFLSLSVWSLRLKAGVRDRPVRCAWTTDLFSTPIKEGLPDFGGRVVCQQIHRLFWRLYMRDLVLVEIREGATCWRMVEERGNVGAIRRVRCPARGWLRRMEHVVIGHWRFVQGGGRVLRTGRANGDARGMDASSALSVYETATVRAVQRRLSLGDEGPHFGRECRGAQGLWRRRRRRREHERAASSAHS